MMCQRVHWAPAGLGVRTRTERARTMNPNHRLSAAGTPAASGAYFMSHFNRHWQPTGMAAGEGASESILVRGLE